MKAIRGATTVSCDIAEEIKTSVKELLQEIKRKNSLEQNDIVFILFTNTDDIKSYYPAKAAREAGFYHCALFSSAEPDIAGSLPHCIRVMVLVECDETPIHVYLRGAQRLRKDLTRTLNIALDGPAGSGKSTVSKIVAKRLNILCLDTGAMYRACALQCLRAGADLKNESEIAKIVADIDISVKYEEGGQRTLLDGEDVSEKIREPQVSMAASGVSALKCVREKMVALQRKIASEQSCILDGRDIGSNVLPDAPFKFYLTASPEVRAQRRFDENKSKGFLQKFEDLLADIKTRDEQDMNRAIAPLTIAEDATVIDSSDMTIDEVVAAIENKVQEGI